MVTCVGDALKKVGSFVKYIRRSHVAPKGSS